MLHTAAAGEGPCQLVTHPDSPSTCSSPPKALDTCVPQTCATKRHMGTKRCAEGGRVGDVAPNSKVNDAGILHRVHALKRLHCCLVWGRHQSAPPFLPPPRPLVRVD